MAFSSWVCTNANCPCEDNLEPNSICGGCGEKAEQVSYLNRDALIASKHKRATLKSKILFTLETDLDVISDKVEEEIVKLAELENSKYGKDDAEIKTLIATQKIMILEQELILRTLMRLDRHFERFFGPP